MFLGIFVPDPRAFGTNNYPKLLLLDRGGKGA